MKRKLFCAVIAVLIVGLTLGMLLTACDPKDKGDDGGKTPQDVSRDATDMLSEVWNKAAGSGESIGKAFTADFDIDIVIDDRTQANADASYKIVGKANVNVNEGKESDIFVEIVETKAGAEKVLAGFAYDIEKVGETDTPYFYININGGGYRKINAVSLTQLAAGLESALSGNETVGGVLDTVSGLLDEPSTLFGIIVNQLGIFNVKGVVSADGKTYTFTISVENIMKSLGSLAGGDLLTMLGVSSEQLDGVADALAGLLGIEGASGASEVFGALAEQYKFVTGRLVFTFDDAGKLGATLSVENNANNNGNSEAVAGYTVTVNKADLAVSGAVDVFAGTSITDEVRAQTAENLLNFSLKGTAVSHGGVTVADHYYTIEVQSNLNPVPLMKLFESTDKATILEVLGELGYLHIEINEVDANGENPENIITLHSKFSEGFAVANLNLHDASYILSLPIGLGGVYNFDALIDNIMMLLPADETTPGEGEAPEGETPAAEEEDGIDIIGLIGTMLGCFSVQDNDMAANGVTVELNALVRNLVGALGITLDDTLGTVLDQVLDAETMTIKLETPTFGTCEEVATETIEGGIRSAFDTGKTDLIKAIDSLPGLDLTSVMLGDENFSRYTVGDLEAGKCFAIKGVNLKGEVVDTSGFIMAVEGYDPNKTGEQEVTFYIAIGTDLIKTLDTASMVADIAVPDTYPLNGVLKYKATVNVLAHDEGAEVSFSNIKGDEVALNATKGADWFKAMMTKTYQDIELTVKFTGGTTKTFVITQDEVVSIMKGETDVTESVLAGGMTEVGTYTVTIGLGGYNKTITYKVDSARLELKEGSTAVESIEFGVGFKLPEYKVIVTDPDGTEREVTLEPTFKMGVTNITSKMDEYFDIKDGVYTLKKDLNYAGKNFVITYSVPASELASGKTDLTVNIPVTGVTFIKGSMVYPGQSLNNYFKVTIADVTYQVVYRGGQWIAESADGKTVDCALTFEWGSAGSGNAVIFNEAGQITNYDLTDTATSKRVYYTLSIAGYTYSYNFTAYELYASDKTSSFSALEIGEKLDGFISNVNRLPYEADGETKELEFKYGAEGYGIYVEGTDTLVYTVTVKVMSGESDVTATIFNENGGMNAAGEYEVSYAFSAAGVDWTISHTVKVNAAE